MNALKRRWSTEYWSQRYQRFDQTRPTLGDDQNPALVLDTRRLFTSIWTCYVGALLDADEQQALARMLVRDVPAAILASDGIERAIRQGGGRRMLVAIDHTAAPAPFTDPPGGRLVLGDLNEGQFAGHGVAVIALAYTP